MDITAPTIQDNIARLRSLFSAWHPTQEELEVWGAQLRAFNQFDVQLALNQHKATTPDFMPNLSKVLALCRENLAQRELSKPPVIDNDPEYESTRQWIDRTLAGATPELLAEIDREMPLAKFCRGVLAVAVEKRQKQRRGY